MCLCAYILINLIILAILKKKYSCQTYLFLYTLIFYARKLQKKYLKKQSKKF